MLKCSLRRAAIFSALAATLAGAQAKAAPPALYTTQQAADGQQVFSQNCAACHGSSLQGGVGPKLTGQDFAAPASKYTLGSIFTLIATQMPDGACGSLTHTQYEDAMAYILSKNGFPAGTAKLDYAKTLTSTMPLVSQVP